MGELDADVIREVVAVVPYGDSEGGGVQIEFHACGFDFEAELSNNGNLRSVSFYPAEDTSGG